MANPIRIWKNRGLIMEGVKNNMFKTAHVENIAFFRNEICNNCEFIDKVGGSCAMIGTQPCCSECGCSLAFKTRSLASDCPKGFWKAELTEAEEQALLKQIKE